MNGSIIRVSKQERYTVLDNRFLSDPRISFRAVGVLAYLLSKPNDWNVSMSDLCERHTEGRDALYAVIKELTAVGYIIRRQNRLKTGRVGPCEMTVIEWPEGAENVAETTPPKAKRTPLPKKPHTVKPETVLSESPLTENPYTVPLTEKPYRVNTTLLSTEGLSTDPVQDHDQIQDLDQEPNTDKTKNPLIPQAEPRARKQKASGPVASAPSQTLFSVDDCLEQRPEKPAKQNHVLEIFEHWQKAWDQSGRARLTPSRKESILKALKTYSLEDCLQAIDGFKNDPWEERPQHADISILLRFNSRNGNNLERGLQFKNSAPATRKKFERQETLTEKREREVQEFFGLSATSVAAEFSQTIDVGVI